MKNPFGVEEARLYGFVPTRDGRWMVGYGSDGKWVNLADLYDSEAQAKEIAQLLSARDMQHNHKDEMSKLIGAAK